MANRNSSPPLPSEAAQSSPSDAAEQFGLAGLTVLTIPDLDNIAAVYHQAGERYDQLLEGSSTQDTLIYYGATASHMDALDAYEALDGYGLHPSPAYITTTFFGDESGLLFVRMLLPVHQAAHRFCLSTMITRWVVRMGLWRQMICSGSETYRGTNSSGIKREAEDSIRPVPRYAFDQFPTLVIASGSNESVLRMEKDWWFVNSPPGQPAGRPRGDVKIVLLVRVERQQKRIHVEKWYRGQQSPSQTVTVTPHPVDSDR